MIVQKRRRSRSRKTMFVEIGSKTWPEQPPERPVDTASWAKRRAAEVVESISRHAGVQVTLASESTLERELVRLAATASER